MHRLILFSLLLACGAARASDWGSLGKSGDGKAESLVDVASIRITGQIRLAWIKAVFSPHTTKGATKTRKWLSYFVTRQRFDCGDDTMSVEAMTEYYDDGSFDSAPAELFPSRWTPVVPDTVYSTWMQAVCAWKPE